MRRVAPAPPVKYAPGVAPRPAPGGGTKTLGGFKLRISSSYQEDRMRIDPLAQEIEIHPKTWAWAKHDNAAMGTFVFEKAEAVRLGCAVNIDLTPFKPSPQPVMQPPVPLGITVLCRDLAALVGELAALDPDDAAGVQRLATRYGKLRDTVATLRAGFTEAEGNFEIAQQLLLQKMGLDDGQ